MQALIKDTLDKHKMCVVEGTSSRAIADKSLPRWSWSQSYIDRHGTRPSERVLVLWKHLMSNSTKMIFGQTSVLIGLFSLLVLVVLVLEVDGITPEDVRFASLRCQNDSTEDPSLRLQWSMRMFPDNHETHCYVKCLLSKLGLINLKHRGLDSNKLVQPLESEDIEVTEECLNKLDEEIDGTCVGYYKQWIGLRKSCQEFFYISLFEDPREVEKYGKQNSKELGETASEFCSKVSSDSDVKELTSEQTLDDNVLDIFKCELGCIFRHIYYFDAYGRADKIEILRSFNEANSNSKVNSKIISKCVHRSNSLYSIGICEMAYELYQCLLKQIKNFKEIYAQRDKISRYY